jgi:hypothetical protein
MKYSRAGNICKLAGFLYPVSVKIKPYTLMILDGKKIAAEIYDSLKIQVQELPTLPTL